MKHISITLLKVPYIIIFFILTIDNLFAKETVTTQLFITKTLMAPTAEIITLKIQITHNINTKILINQLNPKEVPAEFYTQFLVKKNSQKVTNIKHISYTHNQNILTQTSQMQKSFTYTFQVFEVEDLFVSPIEITVQHKTGDYSFYTAGTFIHILPPEKGLVTSQVKSIYEPDESLIFSADFISEYYDILLILIVFCAFIAILLFSYTRIRKYLIFKNCPLEDPYTQANISLSEIEELIKDSDQSFNKKNCYQIMTHTLKLFIERHYCIRTLESTPNETQQIFKKNLQAHSWHKELIAQTHSFSHRYYNENYISLEQIHKDLNSTRKLLQYMHEGRL